MDGQHLHILWTNADPVVFDKMVLMYAVNSLVRGWWEKVTVILWGDRPSGGRRSCGEGAHRPGHGAGGEILGLYYLRQGAWGVEQALRDMGLEVISWGPPLTELLKTRAPLLTV